MPGGGGPVRTVVQQEFVSPDSGIINLDLDSAHNDAVKETEKNEMTQECRDDYCNRIQAFIGWVKENYPDYYTEGVVDLEPCQIIDNVNFGSKGQQKQDLVYRRLNVDLLKAYISSKRFKANGMEYSFVHVRKHKNAIDCGVLCEPNSLYLKTTDSK